MATINQMAYPCCTNQTVKRVCGTFETPTNPDQGRCHTYRVKLTCEAPSVPSPPCGNDEYIVVYDPDNIPHFSIISILLDSNCEQISDSEGQPILTVIN